MKTITLFMLTLMLSFFTHSATYWTVKAENGIMATSSGRLAINLGRYIPTGPNPSGTAWEECYQNWIYFNKRADGTLVEEAFADRMYSTALAAYKTDSHIRVSIDRDSGGRCYTTQIYDIGNK